MSETLEPALPDDLDERAERLMHALCDRGWEVATAESCTGGMLAALLTEGIKAVDLKVDGVIRAVRRAGLGTFLPVEDVESEEVESALLPA